MQGLLESKQFTCEEYQAGHSPVCSISAVGHRGGDAATEEFFGLPKREQVNRRHHRSAQYARSDVFNYIERLHHPGTQQRLDAQDQKFSVLTELPVKTG